MIPSVLSILAPSATCALIVISTIYQIIFMFNDIFSGFLYYLHCILALFVVYNMIGNLLACCIVDTSVKSINDILLCDSDDRSTWEFCKVCKVLAPPRSRHCDGCGVCVLRRDHHCYFTNYCVGYYNYRYFMNFVIHVAISTTYAVFTNIIYFWMHRETFLSEPTMPWVMCPVISVMKLLNRDWAQNIECPALPVVFFIIDLLFAIISICILCFHIGNLLTGATCYERRHGNTKYDLGSWRRNTEMALGQNLFFTWFSPFIRSKMPDCVLHWKRVRTEKES